MKRVPVIMADETDISENAQLSICIHYLYIQKAIRSGQCHGRLSWVC
jgi:hypothetical protein